MKRSFDYSELATVIVPFANKTNSFNRREKLNEFIEYHKRKQNAP